MCTVLHRSATRPISIFVQFLGMRLHGSMENRGVCGVPSPPWSQWSLPHASPGSRWADSSGSAASARMQASPKILGKGNHFIMSKVWNTWTTSIPDLVIPQHKEVVKHQRFLSQHVTQLQHAGLIICTVTHTLQCPWWSCQSHTQTRKLTHPHSMYMYPHNLTHNTQHVYIYTLTLLLILSVWKQLYPQSHCRGRESELGYFCKFFLLASEPERPLVMHRICAPARESAWCNHDITSIDDDVIAKPTNNAYILHRGRVLLLQNLICIIL